MTLVNLDNGIRFTNAGWQLVALLPVINKKQGNYKGKMPSSTRAAKLFHDCVKEIFSPLVDAYKSPRFAKCSDGFTRKSVPLVAAWLGDREEHEVVCSMIKVFSGLLTITKQNNET